MLGNGRIHNRPARFQRRQRARLICPHELRKTLGIHRHNGRQFTLNTCHVIPSFVLFSRANCRAHHASIARRQHGATNAQPNSLMPLLSHLCEGGIQRVHGEVDFLGGDGERRADLDGIRGVAAEVHTVGGAFGIDH